MVIFNLEYMNNYNAVYYYYPEKDTIDYGIIVLNTKTGNIKVTKSHTLDLKVTVPTDNNEVNVYYYASHAVNKIIDEFTKNHKVLEHGKVMWY